jgi:hypothetical protein
MEDSMMKGALFVHMIEFAQSELGEVNAEGEIQRLGLESGGAYTATGRYPFAEFERLHDAFAKAMQIDGTAFSRRVGQHILPLLVARRTIPLETHPFDFLEQVHDVIHQDVRKLYHDSNPPSVRVAAREGEHRLVLRYESPRPMASLCRSMLEATMDMFACGDLYRIERIDAAPRTEHFAEFAVDLKR